MQINLMKINHYSIEFRDTYAKIKVVILLKYYYFQNIPIILACTVLLFTEQFQN